jgi:glycerate dehydrogenase
MKIVVLEAETMEHDSTRWRPIEALGELIAFDDTKAADVVSRIGDADIVLTNKIELGDAEFSQLPNLKFVAETATGFDNIDLESAKRHGVTVSNVPVYSTLSVAQHVFAMLLSFNHRPFEHDQAIRSGDWQRRDQFCFWLSPLQELAGKSLGIVGFGRIGQATARLGQAFGMSINITSRTKKQVAGFEDSTWYAVDELFANSDIVSLHCPQTESNRKFVNKSLLDQMKPTAIFINTARGSLVNEHDLADALNTNLIAGACLDVLSHEPINSDNPLLAAKHCLLTPHHAWTTVESRQRLMTVTAENIQAFQNGTPINVIV